MAEVNRDIVDVLLDKLTDSVRQAERERIATELATDSALALGDLQRVLSIVLGRGVDL